MSAYENTLLHKNGPDINVKKEIPTKPYKHIAYLSTIRCTGALLPELPDHPHN
jgi:hypothetical protein